MDAPALSLLAATRAMRWPAKLALVLLLGAAALLRCTGLSHDLHEGLLYHPDVPKQVNAIEQFYRGNYYWHVGHKDYDGYPILHAHLIEYLLRIVLPVRDAACQVLGLPPAVPEFPSKLALCWWLLSLNALLSTATVGIVFRMGRAHFSPAAGWIAALLMALSPTDLVASHLPTGDAATAFFTALSVLGALQVRDHGRYRDYALVCAAAAFAFAAKYYALIALFSLAVAHFARFGPTQPAAWLRGAALRRIFFCAAVTILSLFLAIPGLFTNFAGEASDIWAAMRVSSQRFPEDLEHASRWAKFLFSMRFNLPDLLRSISPVSLAAVAALLASPRRRDARTWLLLIPCILYVLLAVGSRGPVNPVYHTAITPNAFLLTAFALASAGRITGRWRQPALAGAAAAAGTMCALLGFDAARETFFSLHMDTRRLAQAWAGENVPRTFSSENSRYTFGWQWRFVPGAPPPGIFTANSDQAPIGAHAGATQLIRFEIESSPLTQFRNIGQTLSVSAPDLLRDGFRMPPMPRWPSATQNQFIMQEGAELLRSGRSFLLGRHEQVKRWFVSERPLEEVWIFARTPAPLAKITARFGGQEVQLRTTSTTVDVAHVVGLRPGFPSAGGILFYRLDLESESQLVRIDVATSAGDAGRHFYDAGRFADAAPLLAAEALRNQDPGLAALALIAAQRGGAVVARAALEPLATRAASVLDDRSFLSVYGLSSAYLNALPFLRFAPDELDLNGYRDMAIGAEDSASGEGECLPDPKWDRSHPAAHARDVRTRLLPLDAGRYTAQLQVCGIAGPTPPVSITFNLSDRRGRILGEEVSTAQSFDGRRYTTISFPFAVPAGQAGCRLAAFIPADAPLAIGGLEVRPDILGNARDLAKEARSALGRGP